MASLVQICQECLQCFLILRVPCRRCMRNYRSVPQTWSFSCIDVISVFISARVCQRVELTARQLAEEKSALQLGLKQLEADKEQLCADSRHVQKELKHTLDMLSRYKHRLLLALCQLVDFSII